MVLLVRFNIDYVFRLEAKQVCSWPNLDGYVLQGGSHYPVGRKYRSHRLGLLTDPQLASLGFRSMASYGTLSRTMFSLVFPNRRFQGWYAVRREMRKTMIAFLALSALFIVAWGGMFVCQTWRLTFITWMFFRIISITAVVLTVLAFGLSIACWLNFVSWFRFRSG